MDGSRICPECHARTEARHCTKDGFATVPAAPYADADLQALIGRVYEGRYRVEALIGTGGMGAVYRAMQLSMDRQVALKILPRDTAGNLDRVRRFQAEARAASRLDHVHSIRVIDFGQTEEGELYLVTELLEGESLGQLLAREHRVPADRACRIAAQTLEALAEAHHKGVVHRDVKPDNIFLKRTREGDDYVKVLDFGIAKVRDLDGRSPALTKVGAVVGTPTYMAPEQASGQQVGPETDIYAVGVVLYEMVQGRPPFVADTPFGIMLAQVRDAVPPLDDGIDLPNDLRETILACLAKEPAHRPGPAEVLAETLKLYATPSSIERALSKDRVRAPSKPVRIPSAVFRTSDVAIRKVSEVRARPQPEPEAHRTVADTFTLPQVAPTALEPDEEALLRRRLVGRRAAYVVLALAAVGLAVALPFMQPWVRPHAPEVAVEPEPESPTEPAPPPAAAAPAPQIVVPAAEPRPVRETEGSDRRTARSSLETAAQPVPTEASHVVTPPHVPPRVPPRVPPGRNRPPHSPPPREIRRN